jgi:putative ABC transport system ATP-binding protein
MEKETIITLREIRKDYSMGDNVVHALRQVHLQIEQGEFMAVMGASGSGKSTLMNILGCLDSPTAGTYILDKEDTRRLSPNRLAALRNRKIGFVFQAFNLLPRTTALENVELPLMYDKTLSSRRIRALAMEALEKVGLQERALHYSNQLSGGQQQRVAIARAIVNNPVLLLADEPTGNLDSAISMEIMALFQQLNKDTITVVMVTHEPDIAEYATRRILFKDGRLISDEPVRNRRFAQNELKTRIPSNAGEVPE